MEKIIAAYVEQYKDVNEAYQAIKKVNTLRKSNVPIAMTLEYRIWETVEESKCEAEDEYKSKRGWRAPGVEQTPLSRRYIRQMATIPTLGIEAIYIYI